MTADSISITGKEILVGAEGSNKVIGNPVTINPGGGSVSSEAQEGAMMAGGAKIATGAKDVDYLNMSDEELRNYFDSQPLYADISDSNPFAMGLADSNGNDFISKNCPTFSNIELHPITAETIEAIESKLDSRNWLQKALPIGTGVQIFTKQDPIGAGWNISQTDWDTLTKAVAGVDKIAQRAIQTEAELAILDLQSQPRGSIEYRDDINLLKAIIKGCK